VDQKTEENKGNCSHGNYVTRCGYPVRIYARDGGISGTRIHGAILVDPFGWSSFSWQSNGQAYISDPVHDYDLIEIHHFPDAGKMVQKDF
jgi:hypothetical protein